MSWLFREIRVVLRWIRYDKYPFHSFLWRCSSSRFRDVKIVRNWKSKSLNPVMLFLALPETSEFPCSFNGMRMAKFHLGSSDDVVPGEFANPVVDRYVPSDENSSRC
jgi:hypothetical protein